jgi:small-conductance mechanosensitive channel
MDTIRNLIEGYNQLLASNIIYSWLIAVLIVFIGYFFLKLIKNIVHRQLIKWAQKSETSIDDHVTSIVGQTKNWFLLALAIYVASFILVLPDQVTAVLQAMVVIAIMIQCGLWGIMAINIIIFERMNVESAKTITRIIKVVIWTIIALLALDNLPGVSVDTLIASLGVTGIIVGLAVQGILGDLFSSFLITLDRPIEEGDYIVLDEYSGTVEKIGWKSTRIRSISGELIIVSNSDLVNSRLRNYQRMPRRRIGLKIGVLYQLDFGKIAITC